MLKNPGNCVMCIDIPTNKTDLNPKFGRNNP